MYKLYKETKINCDQKTNIYFMKYNKQKYRILNPTIIQKLRAKKLETLKTQKCILDFELKKEANKYIREDFNRRCCEMEPLLEKEQYEDELKRLEEKTAKKEQKKLKKTLKK